VEEQDYLSEDEQSGSEEESAQTANTFKAQMLALFREATKKASERNAIIW
jgi:hypothetical protein